MSMDTDHADPTITTTDGEAGSRTLQLWCAWSGVIFVALVFAGFLMAGLLPPPSPNRTATEVADFWGTHSGLKRCGLLLMMTAAGFQVPFGVLLSLRIKRTEGSFSPLAYIMLVATGLAVVTILLPTFIFAAASYRPERSPDITQALNDMGWLPFVMNWPSGVIMAVVLAFAILRDHRPRPLFPRWLAYFSFWTALLSTGGGFAIFFKSGVFAWNGLIAFWVGATVFGLWFLVVAHQLLTTIPASATAQARQEDFDEDDDDDAESDVEVVSVSKLGQE